MTQQTPETPSGSDVREAGDKLSMWQPSSSAAAALLFRDDLANFESTVRQEERTRVAQLLEAARRVCRAMYAPENAHALNSLQDAIAAFDVEKDTKP